MPRAKAIAIRLVNDVHRSLFRATRGRIGGKLGPMPVVELTTTGRRSGRRHTVMLTSPAQRGDAYVVVASYGGDDHHPAWFLNLRDHPEVEVVTGGQRRTMKARVASAEERAELWPEVVERYKGYAGYQRKTDREIPLVFLEPA
jgi:deazaflavin-dependent oxidoreductase (nitroreductase family)